MIKSLLIISLVTLVHSWYPATCCSEADCKPVPCERVVHRSDGKWELKPSGVVFERAVSSPDSECHECHAVNSFVGRCLFLPQSNV